jgi:hypothetical protein
MRNAIGPNSGFTTAARGSSAGDLADGRLVPNATEQAAIEKMKAMRKANKTLREIGAALDMPHKTVARILDREKVPDR